MNRKAFSISSSLILVAVVLGALWLARSHRPGDSTGAPASAPPSASASSEQSSAAAQGQRAARTQEPLEGGAGQQGLQRASGGSEQEPLPRKPTLGLSPSMLAQPPLTPEQREKHRDEVEYYQRAWDKHVAPLLYPPGHPLEGTYLDSVTLDQAVEAQLRYHEETTPPGYLDKPYLRVAKQFNYRELNHRANSWDRHDLASSREFYNWMVEQPADPNGPWGDIWVPADPADPDAITRRKLLEERIRAQEAAFFAKPAP